MLGLYFKLDPGWHVYWSNAGDSGEPPTATWTLPPGITAGAMQFPAPTRLPLGPLMDFGYENTVLFPVPLHVADSVKAGTTAHISADIHWLVCREVCIPGKGTLTLDLPIAPTAAANSETAALFAQAAKSLPGALPSGQTATAGTDAQNFVITLHTGQRETAGPVLSGRAKSN